MSEFYVGQKVVKIKIYLGPTPPNARRDIGDIVVDGQIYEIRWVGISDFKDAPGVAAVRVIGVNRCTQSASKPGDITVDCPWGAIQFRPLLEDKIKDVVSKGVSIFRKIARDVTEGRKVEIVE